MAHVDTDAPEVEDVDVGREQRGGFGSLGSITFLLLIAWGSFLALQPLGDNSFFTHLATGRIILEETSVPSTDPYSFTAQGEPWTVQSWLASVAYAGAERLGGAVGVRLLVLGVFVVATSVLWRLTRKADSILVRLGVAASAMVVASGVWSERPFMVGFIGLAVVWLSLEGEMPAWPLVPLLWIWGNTHGSFPLAIVLCLAVLAGTTLDTPSGYRQLSKGPELRTLGAVTIGTLAAAISPLGLKALGFPLQALARSETFGQIVEWRAPEFTSTPERMFLVLAMVAVGAVVSLGRWRYALPVIVFAAAALTARRNLVMALPVLVPVIASAAPTLGTLRSRTRPLLGAGIALLMFVVVGLNVAVQLDRPDLTLAKYPVRALAWTAPERPHVRTLTQDFTGNFLEVLDGTSAAVFIDDRADMFPDSIVRDYQALNHARTNWSEVLERYEIDAIVWERDHPLAVVLAESEEWHTAYADTSWIVACRRATGC